MEGQLKDAQRMIQLFDCLCKSKTQIADIPDLINAESVVAVFNSNPDLKIRSGTGSDFQAAILPLESREMPSPNSKASSS